MEIDLENDHTKIMNDLLMNYFIWGGAHHNQRQFLVEMMHQSSILDYKIDLQTYLKAQLCLYYSDELNTLSRQNLDLYQVDRSNYILYFYMLFANEDKS